MTINGLITALGNLKVRDVITLTLLVGLVVLTIQAVVYLAAFMVMRWLNKK